ncbi:piggyBac transposable element-derived protein 3-like [Aphis craccivora]|uniref:PiggyBac transposable element-derived protein 3-like n=1 Tax=Aphis craccivora TaxID=307492 RepID=A0A6G0ZDX7_APHCR|nr:piggyBac transposable element-derived protein 3-like [Aphis craccivora]
MKVWSNILGDIVANNSYVEYRLDLDTRYGKSPKANTVYEQLFGKAKLKLFAKKEHGYFETTVDKSDGILYVRWMDNAVLTMISISCCTKEISHGNQKFLNLNLEEKYLPRPIIQYLPAVVASEKVQEQHLLPLLPPCARLWVQHTEKKRCAGKNCNSTVRTICSKCSVGFCINCFKPFHSQ